MASKKELTNGKYVDDQMGNGVPEGGSYGQVLKKNSDADYDVGWGTVAATSSSTPGTVTSVGAGTGMNFTSIITSGNVSIDTAKVPYYSSAPSNGLLKYTSGTWGVDTSTYLTTAVTSIATSGLISGGTITGTGTISTSMATGKLVGRSTAGTGVMEEITIGTGLSLSGGILTGLGSSGTFTSDITVYLTGTKTLGRFASGQVIPSNGKTPQEVVTLLAQEPIPPTVTISRSPTNLPFYTTSVSNTISVTRTVNAPGTSITSVLLEWKRANQSTWVSTGLTPAGNTIASSYVHTDTNVNTNTNAYNYRYTVVDNLGGTTVVTTNVTISSYVAPSISLYAACSETLVSPETDSDREWGHSKSNLSGSWARNSPLVPMTSYQYFVQVNAGSFTNIGAPVSISSLSSGSFASVFNAQATSTTTSIVYRVDVIDAIQTTQWTYSISLSPIIFYGEINVATTINSAAIRALTRKFANDGVNPFVFASGTTNRRWLVAMDTTHTLLNAYDITQNINLTTNFSGSSVSVDDAATTSNSKSYYLYNYTNAVTYSSSVDIRITYS